MAVEYQLTVRDYLGIVRRHLSYVIIVFVVVLMASIAAAILIPPEYQSEGTIMIESQQIPTDFVKDSANSFADERIEIVKQRVMTRENLIKVIDKYQLFADKKSSKSLTDIVELTKNAITISLVSANAQGHSATIAFKIAFSYQKPEVAHAVANELITLFLAENIKSRTERATETTEFLEKETTRQKEELENIESKVADYKRQHANALPENADMHMTILQRDETALRETERDIKTTDEELRYLDVELASAKAGVGFNKAADSTALQVKNPVEELESAKAEYTKLSSIYNEEHPTLRALKRKVEKLEASVQANSSSASGADNKSQAAAMSSKDLIVAKVQAQIDSAKSRKESLIQQKQALRASLAQMESSVSQTPQVQLGLTSLLRDYDSAKAKYTEMLSKVQTAKVAENLEQENKAEHFTLLEPPVFPEKPTKPNRKKIIGLGFGAGLGLGLGLAMLLEMIDGRLRGVEAIAAHFNMKPLVVVPYMRLGDEVARRRKVLKYSIIGILVFALVAVYLVHVFVMPIDILVSKIPARFNEGLKMEKMKSAIEKARLSATETSLPRKKNTPKLESDDVITPVPSIKHVQNSASVDSDIDKIDYDKTQVVKLDLNHLDKNRIIALNERDPRTSIIDSLRTQVIQKMEENNWRTLAIISPTPACGKTSIAINLAISIAEQPQKTAVLVDFDLRRPRVATYLGLKVEKSMNDYLHGNAELQDVLVNPSVPRLVVLPTTRPVNKSSEMLATSKVSNLIKELKGRYDSRIVIVDLPPMLNSDDAMIVLPQVDCALMVVGNGLVTEADINESMRLLAKINLLGIVINKAEDVQIRDYY